MIPTIVWAQTRSGFITITFKVPESGAIGATVARKEKHSVLSFHSATPADDYVCEIDLYGLVKEEGEIPLRRVIGGYQIVLTREGEFWPRLGQTKRMPNVSIDWDNWQESSDDEPAQPDFGMGGMGMPDMGAMAGMGAGMGGMGGMGAGMPGFGDMGAGMDFGGMGENGLGDLANMSPEELQALIEQASKSMPAAEHAPVQELAEEDAEEESKE